MRDGQSERVADLNEAQLRAETGRDRDERRAATRISEFDLCPMGCGRTTDDPYGGPCNHCWNEGA